MFREPFRLIKYLKIFQSFIPEVVFLENFHIFSIWFASWNNLKLFFFKFHSLKRLASKILQYFASWFGLRINLKFFQVSSLVLLAKLKFRKWFRPKQQLEMFQIFAASISCLRVTWSDLLYDKLEKHAYEKQEDSLLYYLA